MNDENDNQELNELPQCGTTNANPAHIGRMGSRHEKIAERGFNYAWQKPLIDDSFKTFVPKDKKDFRNFRHDAIPDRDDAQQSTVDFPDEQNSTGFE